MDANHCTLYPYRNDPSLLLDANFVVCLCLSAKRYNNKHQMSSPSYPYVGFVRLARECSNREAMARQTRFMSHAGLPKRCGSAGLSSTGQYPEKFPPPPTGGAEWAPGALRSTECVPTTHLRNSSVNQSIVQWRRLFTLVTSYLALRLGLCLALRHRACSPIP